MRQSEVTQMLKKYGHERGTMHVLMRLAEEGDDLKRAQVELASVVEGMATVITMLNSVAEGMKDKIDGIHRRINDDPRSTHALVTSTDPE